MDRHRQEEFDTLPEFWRVYIMGVESGLAKARDSHVKMAEWCELNERRFNSILGPELLKRRSEQDLYHGGPEHDDTHTPEDWCRFIQDYAYRARIAMFNASEVHESVDFGIVELLPSGTDNNTQHAVYEDRMIDIAALAIAAVQSSRRKHHPMRWLDPDTDGGDNATETKAAS